MNIVKAKRLILTCGLPKTGQIISYRSGDDGEYEAGWWFGKLNANNKTRFISKTISGDDVVIDRATGLMWPADGNEAGCHNANDVVWNDAIDYAEGLSFAGFNDWRLPNVKELLSIVDYSKNEPCIDLIIFPNTSYNIHWTGTTRVTLTTSAIGVDFDEGLLYFGVKASSYNYVRCVRKG